MQQPIAVEQHESLAAERLEALARMGLGGGVAIFSPDLAQVVRSGKPWTTDAADGLEVEARIPHPSTCETDAELAEACRWEIGTGVLERDRRCRVMIAELHLDLGDDERALTWLDGVEDDVERKWWRDRLTRKEPGDA